jgi:hypothetical protein
VDWCESDYIQIGPKSRMCIVFESFKY